MSETGGNNSNINQAVNNSPNSLQNSQNPENLNNYGNQSNNMNPYNSGSTYGGYNSGYGGYGSSYGSNYGSGYGSGYGGGYGSSYGSGYGSSYGSGYGSSSYGSGYGSSSYGSGYGSGYGSNQYSNTYSKPMQQGQGQDQQNQQVPPPNLRHDVWGFLNGFHAILNVLYAGTGIVHFGKMFFKMSIKIIKAVFGKSAGLVYKLTGFQFLKNIMQKLSNKGDWLGEFNVGEAPLENLWSNNGPESANTNRTFFGKFMLVLRILSLMGGIVSFFLRRKVSASQNQQPPVQIEFIDHEIPQVQLRPDVGIEGIKSFYDEVKLIEQDHAEELRDTVSMKEVIEEINEEVKSELKSEVEIEEESPKSVIISEVEEKTLEKLNEDETNPIAVISSTEEEEVAVTLAPEMPSQEIFVPQTLENQEPAVIQTVPETTTTQVTKEQIVSEDFWKNEEVFKKIESIQKESETKHEPFELPSVLKTLKSSSSNATKPWLMKKKKNPEPAPAQEIPIQTLIESATLPTETITPEMPISEVKKENSEVVEIPSTIENPLEGTA